MSDTGSALEARQAVNSRNRVPRPCMALGSVAFDVSQLGVEAKDNFPASSSCRLELRKGSEAGGDLGVCSA